MSETMLHQRLRTVVGRRSYRELGQLTNTNHETVRRYMQGGSPSAEYLSGLCSALNINGEWLLTGQGPVHEAEIRAHALREANPSELLSAIAATLERLIERVERLEVFLQTMELRLRVAAGAVSSGDGPPAVSIPRGVAEVADAVAQRAPTDAGGAPPTCGP